MTPLARKAGKAYSDMKYRCSNPRARLYYRYGARGIKVLMSRRDFMSWFIHYGELFQKDRPDVQFSVGRLDHDDNYMFSNIEVVSHLDNCLESLERNRKICHVCRKEIRERTNFQDLER